MSTRKSKRARNGERRIAADDIGEVIGVAEELKATAAKEMSVADVQSVGRELDLNDAVVSRAVDELEKRRRRDAIEASRRLRRVRSRVTVAAALVGLALLGSLLMQSSLRGAWGRVEQHRAQMRTVLERQASVRSRYAGQPPSAEQDAALSGAENRVAIERRRYDQAAADYNHDAQGFPGALVRGFSGLPSRAPLSNEVNAW